MIITRQEAKLRKLNKYFTGKPCKKGHVASRRVSNGTCEKCEALACLLYASKNRKAQAETARKYYRDNKEKVKKNHKKWVSKNKEHTKKLYKQWCNLNKERKNELQRNWKKLNPEKVKASNAKRRAQKRNAVPKWADLDKIRDIYLSCPKGMEVDHIVPLKGKNICGLHVENNLQYLTPFENNSKGNKYEYLYMDSTGDTKHSHTGTDD